MARWWMSHGTHMNESWHTDEWVMHDFVMVVLSHRRMSHGIHTNESWHVGGWVMAHRWMRQAWSHYGRVITRKNVSWHMHEWVIAHTWMSHGTHMNESWHIDERVMACWWMSHGTQMNATHRNALWSSYYYMRDSFDLVPWLIHLYAMTSLSVPHDSCICVPWLFLCLFHDESICVPCRIHPAATFRDSQIFTQLGWDIYKSTWVPQHPRDTHTHDGLPGIDFCWDDVFTESTGVGFHITITVHTHTHTWTPRYGFPLGWGVYKVNSSGLPHHINPGPTSRDPSPAGCCVCEWF